jgi:5'-nucleotidase
MMKKITILIGLLCVLVACNQRVERQPLQIIFTNDSHSQVEPLKEKGGFEARAAIIDSLRAENENTVLFDAGDMWQGTPYFNIFKGRLEVEAYNLMGYSAVTLGNHEFDYGLDTLAARIREMKFPVVCANYDFGVTELAALVKPYTVIEQNGWKIGVIGVSVNPEGLILQSNIEGVTYMDPIKVVNRYANLLKRDLGCDYIIVLSHLGLHDDTIFNNVSDSTLIAGVSDVDLLLGGHTHQYKGVFKFVDAEGDTVPAIQEYKTGQKIYSITIDAR